LASNEVIQNKLENLATETSGSIVRKLSSVFEYLYECAQHCIIPNGKQYPHILHQRLTQKEINHYDLKCDNILIHPISDTIPEHNFWQQPDIIPNFTLALTGNDVPC
jgi:hypothetical protein